MTALSAILVAMGILTFVRWCLFVIAKICRSINCTIQKAGTIKLDEEAIGDAFDINGLGTGCLERSIEAIEYPLRHESAESVHNFDAEKIITDKMVESKTASPVKHINRIARYL